MNCEQAQQEILMADDPAALPPAIAAHVRDCAQCGKLAAQLTSLAAAANSLPVEGSMAGGPSPLVMERIVQAAKSGGSGGRGAGGAGNSGCLRRITRGAVAAAIVITFGLIAFTMMTNSRSARADGVFRDLVRWNLDISQASPAERAQVYEQRRAAMEKEVQSLSSGDLAVARRLLDKAAILARSPQPVSDVEQFVDIANALKEMEGRSARPAAAEFNSLYRDAVHQGIEPLLNKVDVQKLADDAARRNFERVKTEAQRHLVPATVPAAPGGAWLPMRGGRRSDDLAAPPIPDNIRDFAPVSPFMLRPPTLTVTPSGNRGKGADKPLPTSPAEIAGGATPGNTPGGSAGGNGNSGNAPITQGTTGPGSKKWFDEINCPDEFNSGSPGSAPHHRREFDPDWDWNIWRNYADGNLPGWMKNEWGDDGDGRHVGDWQLVPDEELGDLDLVPAPDGSLISDPIKRPGVLPGFIDFGGIPGSSMPIGSTPEPAAGLLLGIGAGLFMLRRKLLPT
jgi:hypothetical protein